MEDIRLPKCDYHLDHSDRAVIKRQDGSFVAAFLRGGSSSAGLDVRRGHVVEADLPLACGGLCHVTGLGRHPFIRRSYRNTDSVRRP
jgi:hypothetical protein